MTNTPPLAFSVPQRIVHWLTVLLVFFNLLFSEAVEHLGQRLKDGYQMTADDIAGANLHAYVGIAVLALTIVRLVLRLVQGAPVAPAQEPPLFRLIAKAAHGLLYLLLIAMPLAGIGAYYFGQDVAGVLHGGPMKLLLWILVIGHIAAVFVHKFYWKTNVLERMTRGV
jgi:cytochrome b561